MPTYRSIHLALHSQFDIEPFPEYWPEPKESYLARGITGFIPARIDDATSACSVYVPVLPGSTFWISYAVEPPVPAGHYFLFKLYVNGAHIVSWSTGQDDAWVGTTMFGMFESSEGDEATKRVEKRVFCFTPPDTKDRQWKDVADVFDETARIDIKVHRASARKRVERALEEYDKTPHAGTARGIHLIRAGRAGPEQPKRFYKFALIDPIDQPFATFRFYYRTWDQLQQLGLLEQAEADTSADEHLPVIEPQDASPRERTRGKQSPSRPSEDVFFECEDQSAADTAHHGNSTMTSNEENGIGAKRCHIAEQLRAYVPRGAPASDAHTPEDGLERERQDVQCSSSLSTPPRFYGVSVPPSMRLDPSRKSESASSTRYHPHPVLPGGDWDAPSPSPAELAREQVSTSPWLKGRERSALSLMGILPSVWRRRTASGQSHASAATGRDGGRSTV